MIRHPLIALMLGTGALFGALGTACSGTCEGEDCGDASPTELPPPPTDGTCVEADFLNTHPTKWGMVRRVAQEVFVYESPITKEGWYPQNVWSYSLVTWEKVSEGEIRQHEQLCDVVLSEITVEKPIGSGQQKQTMELAVDPEEWVPEDVWDASLKVTETSDDSCTVSYDLTSDTGKLYNVWGANIDPMTDECPGPSDPGWIDQDGDTYEGVTTIMYGNGSHFADTYGCQRLNFVQTTGAVTEVETGSFQILGEFSEMLNDQSMHSSDSSFLNGDDQDPEVRWPGEDSYYLMVSLPDTATCADISPEIFGTE